VYKMDYEIMLQLHVNSGADVTVGCLEVPRIEASGFGVMHVDKDDRIIHFLEKPADPPGMPGNPEMSLASMGIYVFQTKFLINELKRDAADPTSEHDFGKNIIPYLVQHGKAMAHRFPTSCVRSGGEFSADPYWRDVGTIDAYWQANIDLTDFTPALDLYDRDWPIWTYAEVTPPAKFIHDEEDRRGMAVSSMVSGGCIVSGSKISRSLLFTGVRTHSYSEMDQLVAMPYVEIRRNARLTKVVVDRGVVIPEGLVVGEDPEEDARRFRRSEGGVCLITQPMIDRLQG
jgi:glucose-1-phosphate adenylyltransferase